jgi:hypothetical protein
MKKYCYDADMRRAHGLAGRKRVEDSFDNAIVSQAWLDFYKKILEE